MNKFLRPANSLGTVSNLYARMKLSLANHYLMRRLFKLIKPPAMGSPPQAHFFSCTIGYFTRVKEGLDHVSKRYITVSFCVLDFETLHQNAVEKNDAAFERLVTQELTDRLLTLIQDKMMEYNTEEEGEKDFDSAQLEKASVYSLPQDAQGF